MLAWYELYSIKVIQVKVHPVLAAIIISIVCLLVNSSMS